MPVMIIGSTGAYLCTFTHDLINPNRYFFRLMASVCQSIMLSKKFATCGIINTLPPALPWARKIYFYFCNGQIPITNHYNTLDWSSILYLVQFSTLTFYIVHTNAVQSSVVSTVQCHILQFNAV